MGRKRRPNEPSSYVPAPTVPEELSERLQIVMAVINKTMSMSDGATKLNMARNNFQALVHKTQQAMVESLLPKPTGPKPKPELQAQLESEVDRLRRRNEKLERQLQTMDRLLSVAGEVITGLRESEGEPARATRRTPRSQHSSPSSTPSSTDEDEDPEPAALLAKVADVAERGRVARALGMSTATERRLRAHVGAQAPVRRRRQPPPPTPEAEAEVRAIVRDLHGLAGAASLARSVNGVSRRQAAAIKADELAAMERERRAGCRRVNVAIAGVVRGFDGMHLPTTEADHYALIGSDAHVPYRTSLLVVKSYDSAHVAEALDEDFRRHGAPLVCRRDRLAAQHTDQVEQVLALHGVLTLCGPPRYPRFYGQTERQMREHRAWRALLGMLTPDELPGACAMMKSALNRRWRRRRLGGRTAEEVWMERPPVTDDRAKLREEVLEHAARLRSDYIDDYLAMRLAIEKALTDRGYLHVTERQ